MCFQLIVEQQQQQWDRQKDKQTVNNNNPCCTALYWASNTTCEVTTQWCCRSSFSLWQLIENSWHGQTVALGLNRGLTDVQIIVICWSFYAINEATRPVVCRHASSSVTPYVLTLGRSSVHEGSYWLCSMTACKHFRKQIIGQYNADNGSPLLQFKCPDGDVNICNNSWTESNWWKMYLQEKPKRFNIF